MANDQAEDQAEAGGTEMWMMGEDAGQGWRGQQGHSASLRGHREDLGFYPKNNENVLNFNQKVKQIRIASVLAKFPS